MSDYSHLYIRDLNQEDFRYLCALEKKYVNGNILKSEFNSMMYLWRSFEIAPRIGNREHCWIRESNVRLAVLREKTSIGERVRARRSPTPNNYPDLVFPTREQRHANLRAFEIRYESGFTEYEQPSPRSPCYSPTSP